MRYCTKTLFVVKESGITNFFIYNLRHKTFVEAAINEIWNDKDGDDVINRNVKQNYLHQFSAISTNSITIYQRLGKYPTFRTHKSTTFRLSRLIGPIQNVAKSIYGWLTLVSFLIEKATRIIPHFGRRNDFKNRQVVRFRRTDTPLFLTNLQPYV